MGLLLFIGWLLAGIILLVLALCCNRKPQDTHGSAAWLTISQALRKGLFEDKGVIVGDWTGLLPVYYDGTHAITYGSAGSGKGTSVIIPNLLHYRFIFLNDPGGENAAVAIRQWRARGYATFVINPFAMHAEEPWELPSHGFNPFDFLDPASPTFSADAKVLAEILTPRSGREAGSSKYFMDRTESWLHASIVHIKTTEPPARRNPGTMYEQAHLDPAGWDALLAAMKANPACGGVVRSAAIDMERMEAQAPEEFSAVFSTVQQNLDWLAEPLARAAVSASDVDFAALKGHGQHQNGAVIAVVMPLQYKETHKAIPRLALQCAVWEMQRKAYAKQKVLFEIDEAASLGRLERLPQWLAELRKYRVQWSLQFQNVGQPKSLYEKEWQTFQGNAGLKRFVGVGDPETAKEVSEYCGYATVEVRSRSSQGGYTISATGRELQKPDEVLRLEEDEMIAIIENLPPARLKKTPYWNRPEFAGCFYRNPYHEEEVRAEFGTSLKSLRGSLAYLGACCFSPAGIALWLCTLPTAIYLFAIFYGGR